jgi:histidinol-phosphate aminotransferase
MFIRPLIEKLHAYVPGEQPKVKGLIKLNTNENPYPPSPAVLEAVKKAVDGRLRLYPNPTAQPLREALAKLHHCEPANIIVGNGSDELLAMAVRAFVEPSSSSRLKDSRALAQYFQPSYSLYPVLVAAHGAKSNGVELNGDFSLPPLSALRGRGWDFKAALSLITTPNAPSGQGFSTAALDQLCLKQKGIVLLDEAYVDFAKENALELALKHPHVLVARTFSKAYSLCFQRVGYFVGSVELINALQKIRDSYNVNGLGQVAAVATLSDLNYYRENFKRIIASRENISRSLEELGFETTPSQTNFVFTRPPGFAARLWLEKLRENKILVRWFDQEKINDYLRITIGSESEMDYFLKTVRRLRK